MKSKFSTRLRIRPVINSIVAKPYYHFECKDWYGGVGTGLTIRQAYESYQGNQVDNLDKTSELIRRQWSHFNEDGSLNLNELISNIGKCRREYVMTHPRTPLMVTMTRKTIELLTASDWYRNRLITDPLTFSYMRVVEGSSLNVTADDHLLNIRDNDINSLYDYRCVNHGNS